MSEVDELICRPITWDCMEAELHKAMQRLFVPTVTMKLLWKEFFSLLLSPFACGSEQRAIQKW